MVRHCRKWISERNKVRCPYCLSLFGFAHAECPNCHRRVAIKGED